LNIQQQIENWLDDVVIGLQFCPFAQRPRQKNQIQIYISQAESIEQLMVCLVEQCQQLLNTPSEKLETTLVVVPELLADFDDYLDCLYLAEQVLEAQGWQGVFQIASFHPQYQFEGTEIDNLENLTNRSPYPVFHLLRENTVSESTAAYGDTSVIPENNKRTIASLSIKRRKELFNFLD